MTIEELNRIEKKIANGEKLLTNERCEGFSVVDGKVTDRYFHNEPENNEWTEDDEYARKISIKYRGK
jgi:hypothetical protein